MFVLPIRFILLVLGWVIFLIFFWTLTIGFNAKKGPVKKGCRLSMIRGWLRFACAVQCIWSGYRLKKKEIEVDYSEWLGPNYKRD